MQNQAKVGPVQLSDGSETSLRADKQSNQVVTDGHGRYHEAASRGNVFMAASASVTVAATTNSGQSLGTVQPILGICNPLASGKMFSLLSTNIATISGTPGGPFYYNFTTGISGLNTYTAATVRSTYLSGLGGSGVAQVATQGTAMAVIGGATTALTELGVIGGPAAVAAGAGMYQVTDDVAGRIIIPPGTILTIATHTTGTTHVLKAWMAWEEVQI